MWNRRQFLASSTAGLGGLLLAPAAALGADRSLKLNPALRLSLLAAIAREDRRYDPKAQMLRTLFSSPGYHTTLKDGDVHPTRTSLAYAVALLDTQDDGRLERAQNILGKVIGLQDQNPVSKTCGVWPWFLEEPLEKMAPPDLNWADFCAVQLLAAWLHHQRRLGEALAAKTREAIIHAAHAIQRRDVGPGYTNIAIMGAYVTLVAASEFKLADLRDYARARLRRLHDHIRAQGSFTEYNSPAYTIVAVTELSRMLFHVKDGRDLALIRPLHELAWKHIATHFHPPTRQWAGPHSRCYETDLRRRPETLAFLQTALRGQVKFIEEDPLPLNSDACRVPLFCPTKFLRYFRELTAPRQTVETFVQAGPAKAGARPPVTGATWLHPRFTLGSVNRGDFWRQRRPLLAYWGTPQECTHLRLRFLKDEGDFASALLFSAQHEGHLIAAVAFATDHGDSHLSLDKIREGTIQARDLRLRFEFGGELRGFVVRRHPQLERAIVFQDRHCRFLLRPLGDSFGGTAFQWAVPEVALASDVDAVAYRGNSTAIPLGQLEEAFLCFALQEWPYDEKAPPLPTPEFKRAGDQVEASLKVAGKTLRVAGPVRPGSFAALNDAFTTSVT